MQAVNNKIAIVTGGTGALGSVIALRLAQDGCRVFVTSRSNKGPAQLTHPLNVSLTMVPTDVTRESDVINLYNRVMTDCSRVDIVVNTVGGYLPRKQLIDVTQEEWDHMMDLNLKSTFLSAREAVRKMNGQIYGRIINISAMVGIEPTAERIPYAISKSSVSLLTKLLAQEVKQTGITVNAIAPGVIATPANLASLAGEDNSKWVTPEQIADIVLYLCSPAASSITGTTIRAS